MLCPAEQAGWWRLGGAQAALAQEAEARVYVDADALPGESRTLLGGASEYARAEMDGAKLRWVACHTDLGEKGSGLAIGNISSF